MNATTTLDAYTRAVIETLRTIRRGSAAPIDDAARATIAFNHALGTSAATTAHQILDDAMTGNGTL